MLAAPAPEPDGIAWFSFEGATSDGMPAAWRPDLLAVLRAFPGCRSPDDVVLVTAELVSNAVEHGDGVRRLHVGGRSGEVTVEVEDYAPSLRSRPGRLATREGGRGLRIVDDVADDWGWWPTSSGKTVWATFHPGTEEDR